MRFLIPAILILTLAFAGPAIAVDEAALDHEQHVDITLESGDVQGDQTVRSVVFSEIVSVPDARFIRILFDEALLGECPPDGERTILRITSLFDGAVQILDDVALAQWRNGTAYFNGNAVLIEIIADPDAGVSRVTSSNVVAGVVAPAIPEFICGPEDGRVSTADPRVARTLSSVCTAWMINDCHHCFLSAGHCVTLGSGLILVQFNVPPSDDQGFVQHPAPEFQFAVDPNSIQFNDLFANDYAYFGCFPNSNTGLTPFETMGPGFDLFTGDLVDDDRELAITGYGNDFTPGPEVNRTQQTDIDVMTSVHPLTVGYYVDTTAGTSGSPVVDVNTGEAIAIHGYGGCLPDGSGENVGTLVSHPILQLRLDDPRGVCDDPPNWAFEFPDGLPTHIDPAGGVIRVEITGLGADEPVPGTGQLFYDLGFGDMSVPMVTIEPNVYDAVFPPIACGLNIRYYFRAQTVSGETIFHPQFPNTDALHAVSAIAPDASFIDDFEIDTGWTVENDKGLEDGAWERGIPVGFGIRGDPPEDADGSGQCFITANRIGNSDVDGEGETILISPILDASLGSEPTISYQRWFNNSFGGPPIDDSFIVEVSDDGGARWVELETLAPDHPHANGGWKKKSFVLSEVTDLALTDQFRIRFRVADSGFASVVEAGVDDVRMNRTAIGYICAVQCVGDCAQDGDGVVDEDDLIALLADWGQPGPCDAIADDVIDIFDLLALLGAWGPCDQ